MLISVKTQIYLLPPASEDWAKAIFSVCVLVQRAEGVLTLDGGRVVPTENWGGGGTYLGQVPCGFSQDFLVC